MNKPYVSFLILVLFTITACGARVIRGSGVIETELREVDDFNRISVCCGMELIIHQGEGSSVQIESDDNLLPEISSRVSGDRLTVDYNEGLFQTSYRPTSSIKVIVTVGELHGVSVSGGGKLDIDPFETEELEISLSGGSMAAAEQLQATDLNIDISGGGKMTADQLESGSVSVNLSGGSQVTLASLASDKLEVDISGGGRIIVDKAAIEESDFSLSGGSSSVVDSLTGDMLIFSISGGGTAQFAGEIVEQRVEMSGNSTYDAADLKSRHSTIEAGGDATIWATETLEVSLSGGSTVEYRGDPSITQDLSGGSQVIPLRGR